MKSSTVVKYILVLASKTKGHTMLIKAANFLFASGKWHNSKMLNQQHTLHAGLAGQNSGAIVLP